MSKQYRDLKEKHPDAMLLFRCGDFYETYEDDAKECAKVLGITLTKRQSDGVAMAGFPHHALDTYLPKLVRAANSGQMKFKRIAICDQLDPPPGPRPKRGETIDKAAIKREQSDACIDSAEREQAQTKFYNLSTNQNSEAMKQEMKVADLIGKSVSNGNAKYVIKSVDGDKVKVDFAMGDNAAKEMNMKVEQIEKLLQGGWQVSDGSQEPTEKKADEPKAKTVPMGETKKPRGTMPKSKVTLKRKQPQAKEPKAEEPKQAKPQGRLTYSIYTNAKGKTCAKVSGFAETDAAYQKEAAASLHGSATYENTKQGRVNFLLFGPRYAEVAKTVCQMLNEGKTVADCQAVVDAATEERAQKREEWKQKRESYRQEREEHGAANLKPETKVNGKAYSSADVAAILQKVMAGGKLPKDIEEAMMKAA